MVVGSTPRGKGRGQKVVVERAGRGGRGCWSSVGTKQESIHLMMIKSKRELGGFSLFFFEKIYMTPFRLLYKRL